MSKKNIVALTIIATGASIAGMLYFWNKKKIQKKDSMMVSEYDNSNTENEINTNTSDNIVPDMESDDIIDQEMIIHKFIAYLVKNGIDAEEVVSICETITRIKHDLPDKFLDVKNKMIEMMNSEFDLKKSHDFDNENYRIMYSSIDPCQLFIKNGFKILSMGPDYQEDMMNLADTLADLQEENPDDAITVIYEIYHLFNDLNDDDITPSTYNDKFKSYVDKYVTEKANNSEPKNYEEVSFKETDDVEDTLENKEDN